jgi:hypothetical protein
MTFKVVIAGNARYDVINSLDLFPSRTTDGYELYEICHKTNNVLNKKIDVNMWVFNEFQGVAKLNMLSSSDGIILCIKNEKKLNLLEFAYYRDVILNSEIPLIGLIIVNDDDKYEELVIPDSFSHLIWNKIATTKKNKIKNVAYFKNYFNELSSIVFDDSIRTNNLIYETDLCLNKNTSLFKQDCCKCFIL